MKKKEDFTLDDLKAVADKETAGFMEEQAKNMLAWVKEYESEEDYWFVKYYLAPCFSVFILGAMAVNINEEIWFKPQEEVSEELKSQTIDIIKTSLPEEIQNIFEGRDDLLFRLFAYGTHQVQSEMEEFYKEQEKGNTKCSGWSYMMIALIKKKDGSYLGKVYFSKIEKEVNEWFDNKDKQGDWLLMMMRVSPKLEAILENTEKTEKLLYTAVEHKEHCRLLRNNENVLELLGRN